MLIVAWALLAAMVMLPGRAVATVPGTPGVPQPPSVAFTEDFENNVGTTPVRLTPYVGATGQTYTADPTWLSGCNGVIVKGSSPAGDLPLTGCGTAFAYDALRQLSYAQGAFEGAADPFSVPTVAALTDLPGPGANKTQFRTVAPIPLVASNRFLTFSIDVGAFCTTNNPSLEFYLLDGPARVQLFTSPIDPCTDPRGVPIAVPAIGARPANTLRVGTYAANGSALFSGASVGIELVNGQGAGGGNDSAFTNIRILDATPQLDKSFSPAIVNVGQPSTLTFTITNTTELAAKDGWSFSDSLPAGLIVASPAAASTTCSGGTVTAAAGASTVTAGGNLLAGQASCTASVSVTSAGAGAFANSASNVAAVGLNPPGSSTVQFVAADLALVKSASPGTITPGGNVTYTLVVSNRGPDAAVNVRVSDPLPSGLTFVSASPECGAAGANVTCAVGSLAAGATQTFTVTASVAGSVTGRVENTATVASDTPDPIAGDNTSTASVPSEGVADLSIAKTASTSAVGPNGQVLYTLVVENDGPSDATGVTVTDTPPAGLVLQSAAPAQGTCQIVAGRVSCALGSLAAGGMTQVLVTAQTAADASGALVNTATVTGDQRDPDPGDNTTTATVTVPIPPLGAVPTPPPPVTQPSPPPPAPQARADLSITKRSARTRVALGQSLTYAIVVTNNGPSPASDVNVTDTASLAGRLVSVRTSAGTCARTQPITCALGTIAAGGRVTITVVFRPTDTGSLRNAASVTSRDADPTTANNLAVVSARVRPALLVTKLANRRTLSAGQTVAYTIRVRNPSQQAVRNVRTCDRLPPGLVFVSATPRARLTRGQYCWSANRLSAGQSRTYRLTARALSAASGTKVNRATATSPNAATGRARRSVRVNGNRAPDGGVTG